MESHGTPLSRIRIPHDVLVHIHQTDQHMYPAPLEYSRLKSWVAAFPDLAVCFSVEEDDDDADTNTAVAAGVMIALPLLEGHWRNLLEGRITESMIDPDRMLATEETDEKIGLHIFHIERYSLFRRHRIKSRFAELAIAEIVEVAVEKGWKVLGHSVLTASPEGQRAFSRMGFQPTGYKEIFVGSEDGEEKPEMISLLPGESQPGGIVQGKIVARAKMLVRSMTADRLFFGSNCRHKTTV